MKKRKGILKKWLACLMAIALLGQITPVYAAEQQAETTLIDSDNDGIDGNETVSSEAVSEGANANETAVNEAVDEDDKSDEPAEEKSTQAEDATVDTAEDETADQAEQDEPVYELQYQAQCQTIGWQEARMDGQQAGTTGKSKRMETLTINVLQLLDDPENTGNTITQELKDAIEYRAHCQTYGWMDWVQDGDVAGTVGESKRLEAIEIRLKGELADAYDIYYQVHCATFGDMGWAKNGEMAGTSGYSKSIEAITIRLVKKGSTDAPEQSSRSYITPQDKGTVTYAAHCQTYGWMDSVADGAIAGTQGQSKRMEALRIYLNNPKDEASQTIEGSIEYQAHCQGKGWMGWTQAGNIAGTIGESKRLEAVRIRLTGELANQYDVYYRVHSATWGTLGWAKDEEIAGTVGFSCSIQSIEIKLVKKGSTDAPGQSVRSYLDNSQIGALSYDVHLMSLGWTSDSGNGQTAGVTGQSKTIEALRMQITSGESGNLTGLFSGGISYKVHQQGTGWLDAATDGAVAGSAGSGKRIEAVQLTLTGELAKYCDIYYRAHVQDYGWLGWAKNGQSAGTSNCSYRMEALQVCIVPKTASAPGANTDYFKNTRKVTYKRLASFGTHCTSQEASLYNMSKALRSFNGLVVQPGQTISFFGVAGPCGKAQGYMASAVVGGIGYGGGICQASTTIYGAALRAGMTIVERRNHSVASTYVPIGQDAMVSYGSSDLKFRNDFNFPVTMKTWTSGRDIYVEFYGQDPGWFDSVQVNSWKTGSKSAAAERVFYKNGVAVKRERLSNSYYK